MASPTDPTEEQARVAYTTVKVRGREVKVARDASLFEAENRVPQGALVYQSILESMKEMKERDAKRD